MVFPPILWGKNGGVLSMRMQVILDSSFARPVSAPIWGGKEGEFRDWTKASMRWILASYNAEENSNSKPCNHILRNQSALWANSWTEKMNRPFPSSLEPLFQNESNCETFHMKMSSACSFIFMQIKVVFIQMVSHLDSPCNRGTRELENGLFEYFLDYA